jgi:hypothetical protein
MTFSRTTIVIRAQFFCIQTFQIRRHEFSENGTWGSGRYQRGYFASTIWTGLSSWKVNTVSAGTRIEPPLVRT